MGILDDPPYSPGHEDAKSLVERLTALIGSKAAARTVTNRSGIREGDIDWDGRMADVWPLVLAHAAHVGLLRRLVEEAAHDQPEDPLLRRLLDERPTVAAVVAVQSADFWGTARLWKTEAFIDRSELRTTIQQMADPDGYRALLVIGDKGMGKSISRRYFSFLAEKRQLANVRPIDNSTRAGVPKSVQELAQQIASTLAGDKAPKFDLVAQEESVVTQFRGWLAGEVATFDEPVWLVFDGFTSENATAAALQLVHDLAVAAAEYQLGQVRVAVCGFEGPAPSSPGAVSEPLRQPSGPHVREFLIRMAKTLKNIELTKEAADVALEEFVRRGGPVEARELRELGRSALDFAHEIYGPPP